MAVPGLAGEFEDFRRGSACQSARRELLQPVVVDVVVLGDEVDGGSVARRRLRKEESRPKKGSHLVD